MKTILRTFVQSEAGAVTVDWVVLCAGLVAMAVALVAAMEASSLALTGKTDTFMQAQTPN
ncbi:MAG: hypothetical protein AAFY38_11075 [Pseudomonadota bacterium]